MKKNTTVRIYGANKNVRKTFDDVASAKAYIKDKKLHSASADSDIQIEETIQKYHKVKTDFPGLQSKYNTKN